MAAAGGVVGLDVVARVARCWSKGIRAAAIASRGRSEEVVHGPGLARGAGRTCGPTHKAEAHHSQPRQPVSRLVHYAMHPGRARQEAA